MRLRGNCPSMVVVTDSVDDTTVVVSAAGVVVTTVVGTDVAAAATTVDVGWTVAVVTGVVSASLLWAAAISLLPMQLVQSNKRMIRPTRSVVGA